jgi:hypothetical protein
MSEFFVVALFFAPRPPPVFVVDFNCPLLFRVLAMTPQYEQHYSKSWQVYLDSEFGCFLSKTTRTDVLCLLQLRVICEFTDLEKRSQRQKHKKSSDNFL